MLKNDNTQQLMTLMHSIFSAHLKSAMGILNFSNAINLLKAVTFNDFIFATLCILT